MAGPDGALWFTESNTYRIGRITTDWKLTGVSPSDALERSLEDHGSVPDGNLWFTEITANQIGRITVAGVVTEFPIPTGDSTPGAITAGPDGALWFTEQNGNKIGRITVSGEITEFPDSDPVSLPYGIAVGPDGAIWFTETAGNLLFAQNAAGKIGRLAIPLVNRLPLQPPHRDAQPRTVDREQ